MAVGPRVAIVSDTIDEVNGVALGLRRFVAAATRAGRSATLIGPRGSASEAGSGIVHVPAVLAARLPFYRSYRWAVPAARPMLDALRGADVVQLATPGPMGFGALVAARVLGVPVIAQYHTEVAQFAARMTGVACLEQVVDPVVGWFYRRAGLCLAASASVEGRLAAIGVPASRVRRIRRGVDLELFHPRRRDPAAFAAYGVGDGPVVLFVGRLSREKNLATLRAAWEVVRATQPRATLIVVGHGPARSELAGPGVVAVGERHGAELATLFASADVFAFPSETETFGNVVLEAAASGLPSVVAAAGGAHELVLDGVTGDVIDGRDRLALAHAIMRQLDDPARRARMASAARAHASTYDLTAAVASCWRIYDDVVGHSPERGQECAA